MVKSKIITPVTVGLFEDNPIIEFGLSSYFQSMEGFSADICFASANPEEFIHLLKANKPDLVILDIISEETFGLELFEQVFEINSSAKVIAYTNVKSKQIIKTLLAMGVAGYIPKKENVSLFDEAFHHILIENKVYLPENLQDLLELKQDLITLTEMEKKIIPFLLNGFSSKQIAEEFFVTSNAVDFHKKNLFVKFEVNNIASLVKELISQGYSQGISF